MFPDAFSEPPEPSVATTNSRYTGWSVQADRLFFANANRKFLPLSHVVVSHVLQATHGGMRPCPLTV